MSGGSTVALIEALVSEVARSPVTLGPFSFSGNEVPSQIMIGGLQTVAIHRLPGGEKIIDAMGPDESAIQWTGFFTGPFASDRARTLDGMRRTGMVFPLSVADYFLNVIIADFHYILRDRGAVLQYHIRMEVIPERAGAVASTSVGMLTLLAGDLASAVSSLSVGGGAQSAAACAAILAAGPAVTAAGSGGSLVAVGSALSVAGVALSSVIETVSSSLLASGQSTTAAALASTRDAAGALASCVQGAGYLNRASGFSDQLAGLQQAVPLISG